MDKHINCEHCGAKMVEYTFTFNKGLARCLYAMRGQVEGVEIKKLKMTSSMWTNFQKLRYWGLIEPVQGENARKGGYWKLTPEGVRFLCGNSKIQKKAVMYRNELVRFEGDFIVFSEVTGGYQYRQDYKDQVVAQTSGDV